MKTAPKKIQLDGFRFSLRRESDGEGESGLMLVRVDPESWQPIGPNGTIEVGYAIRCGSPYGGTFTLRDWWQTTPVTEILESDAESARVKTRNSIYRIKTI